MLFICSLTFLTLFNFLHCDTVHPLDKRLKTWQTLKQSDLYLHRHKRSLNEDDVVVPVDKQVTFNAFQQTFHLSLMTSPEILAPDFQVSVHGRHGSSSLEIDKTTLMTGTVLGDSKSHVVAHYDGQMLTASIETESETYVVEPMWRHLPKNADAMRNITEHDKSDMIVYRQSDVNLLDQHPHGKNGFCQTKEVMDSLRQEQTANDPEFKETSSNHHRSKRSTSSPIKKICKLSLVADHRFFSMMGNNSSLETMYYLISLVERVNTIYKNTDWDTESGNYKGFGFQINRIRIFNESSDVPRFNQDRHWEASDLLEAFSEQNYSVCLSHLFTYIDFPDGLLGFAYLGSRKRTDVGGICSKSYDSGLEPGKLTLYRNTGLTSTVNWNSRLLTTEADLVTAHELGHSFGADHDDDTKSSETACTPGQAKGGNYIMFPVAVSGQYPNNKKFSDCSKHAIFLTLNDKSDLCFEEDSKAFCGNYQVESENNETCDVGLFTLDDACCFPNCTLRPSAKCSNKNFPCCTNTCQIASTDKLCRAHIPNLCSDDTYCDGSKFHCPAEKPVADGLKCGDKGKCKNGVCQHFCTTKGLHPCLCLDKKNQCNFCCAAANSSSEAGDFNCQPYLDEDGQPIKLKENAPCTLGYCNKGACQKHTQDMIERVWDIFQYIAPDKIGEFLADNIVGAVLVFSLLFWIPCSCLINFVDKKRLKERQKEEQWYSDKGGEFSRSFAFRGIGTGSAPVTPRIRISRNTANWGGGGVALASGFGSRDQWRASQKKTNAVKRSRENFCERLSAVSRSPKDDNALSQSQPSIANKASNASNNRFVRSFPLSLSRSYPSLGSPLSSSYSDKSFDGIIKPIAVSSNANLPAMVESECTVIPENVAAQYRRSFKRQEAVETTLV